VRQIAKEQQEKAAEQAPLYRTGAKALDPGVRRDDGFEGKIKNGSQLALG